MRRRHRLLRISGAILAAATLTCLSNADDFKGIVYEKPPTWTVKLESGGVILTAPNPTTDNLMFATLFPGMKASSRGPKADLTALVDAVEKGLKKSTRKDVQISQRDGLTTAIIAAQVEDTKLGSYGRVYELVSDGQQNAFAIVSFKGQKVIRDQQGSLIGLLASVRPRALGGKVTDEAVHDGESSDGIPYADTLNALPGDVGFRPSGKGIAIPLPRMVDGKPVGLWWTYGKGSFPTPNPLLFYADHRLISHPQIGGPLLYDNARMERTWKSYVGKWEIKGENLIRTYDNGPYSVHYQQGLDEEGPVFQAGDGRFRPAIPLKKDDLFGKWSIKGTGTFEFGRDGSVIAPHSLIGSIQGLGYTGPKTHKGTWFVRGYLLVMKFPDEGFRVYESYRCQKGMIAIDGYFYFPGQ